MGEENCRETISSEELFFFDRKPAALPMYEVFRKSVLAEIPEAGIEVGKTQVSFFIGHMFAAVSFTPVRKAKDRPDPFLTITFGLPRRVESTRINAAAEPRPGRWTHHVMIGTREEIDDEYISEQDAGIQEQLQLVRKAIRDELPEAKEKISWAMPTWWNGHNIIHFAAQKTHIGLYPGPETVACFAERLDEYGLRYSKGSIQIPYSDELPLKLVSEIAAWCRDTGNHA